MGSALYVLWIREYNVLSIFSRRADLRREEPIPETLGGKRRFVLCTRRTQQSPDIALALSRGGLGANVSGNAASRRVSSVFWPTLGNVHGPWGTRVVGTPKLKFQNYINSNCDRNCFGLLLREFETTHICCAPRN